jgi:NADPH:quinone reductase-like Zn-dependent oxidoreductase
MRAIVQERYGSPEVLEDRDVAVPAIDAGEVLIRVRAASVRVGNCFVVRGSPFPVRLMSGLLRPRDHVPGFDLAGVVEAVGSEVTTFRPGDEVFGVGKGAWAEYASALERDIVAKPNGLTFEEAAALPTSGLAALHGLRDAGQLRAGQRVLINGASGGVGTFAVQIAKSMGAEVTGVCSTKNLELVRSIGADHVIDYTRQDFTQAGTRYDLILDNVENRSLSAVRGALAPSGTLVLNGGTGAGGFRMLLRLVRPILLSPFVGQSLRRYLSMPNQADLVALKALVDAGKVRPVIDRTFALAETPAAVRHVESGRARGNVTIALPAM